VIFKPMVDPLVGVTMLVASAALRMYWECASADRPASMFASRPPSPPSSVVHEVMLGLYTTPGVPVTRDVPRERSIAVTSVCSSLTCSASTVSRRSTLVVNVLMDSGKDMS
jgi:hypothetical protein